MKDGSTPRAGFAPSETLLRDCSASGASARVVLVVQGWEPLSMNRVERWHWSKQRSYRSAWEGAVFAYWVEAGQPTFTHPTIAIRCYFKVNRKRDADNAAGGVGKIVMDALKGRAFGDDDAGSVDLQPVELLIDRHNPRVEIELREAALAAGRATAGTQEGQ